MQASYAILFLQSHTCYLLLQVKITPKDLANLEKTIVIISNFDSYSNEHDLSTNLNKIMKGFVSV